MQDSRILFFIYLIPIKIRAPLMFAHLPYRPFFRRPFFNAGPFNAGPNSAGFENEANAY